MQPIPPPQDGDGNGILTIAELVSIGKKYFLEPVTKNMSKESILQKFMACPIPALHEALISAVKAKRASSLVKGESRKRKRVIEQQKRRVAARIVREHHEEMPDVHEYLSLPTEEEVHSSYRSFYDSTSTCALKMVICAICAREELEQLVKPRYVKISEIPNSARLVPSFPHKEQVLTSGLLLEQAGLSGDGEEIHVCICQECYSDLQKPKESPPKYSLANGLWIGDQPWVLKDLSFPEQLLISLVYPRVFVFKLSTSIGYGPENLQRGMHGTVSSYELDVEGITDMVQGNMLPRPPAILATMVSVTFIGRGKIPLRYLRRFFSVRRAAILDALQWLKINNPKYFGEICISEDNLKQLPENGVPTEITDTMRQYENEEILTQEDSGYVRREMDEGMEAEGPGDGRGETVDEEADVIRMEISGTSDIDLSKLSANELKVYALENLWKDGKEGGYEVRHGTKPVSDYGYRVKRDETMEERENFWEKSFPFLFPYGRGGFEGMQHTRVDLRSHVQWALKHHKKQFRKHETFPFVAFGIVQRREALASAKVQINNKSYERNRDLINSVTFDKLIQAEVAESNGDHTTDLGVQYLKNQVKMVAGRVMGSDYSRIRLRSQIWSTAMYMGPPTIWLTVNPSDIHDPVAQVFVGKDIDMDRFSSTSGPDKQERAKNIAADPYAAAKFFHFIIDTIFETLVGVKIVKHRVKSAPGIFGKSTAYFGTVESQGRGTLHLHTLIWLKDTPSSSDIHRMLQTELFRAKVRQFIAANFRAYLPGLESKESTRKIPQDSEVSYSRPVNPDSVNYLAKLDDFELRLARMEQVHTCQPRRCLIMDNKGRLRCKRRAPFKCADEDFVREDGQWGPKRLYGYVNTWVPGILLNACCNNDGKLLTSGAETKNITFYVTSYAAKKQGRNFNLSAVMAKGYAFHVDLSRMQYSEQLRDTQRLLLFRLVNAINREQELSGPMVVSYLMGWGDVKRSHTYTPIYWTVFVRSLLKQFRSLDQNHRREDDNKVVEEDNTGKDTVDGNQNDLVTLSVNSEGRIVCASQVVDYQLRGNEMENYSVLDFFVDTYEEDISRSSARVDTIDEGAEVEIRRGRPPNQRARYLNGHPKYNEKCRVRRSVGHRNLPNMVGNHFPRNDDANEYELYCASVLLLLKPWRKIEDLKPSNASWACTLEQWSQECPDSDRCQFIMSGIQYYHECVSATKENRDDDDAAVDDYQTEEKAIHHDKDSGNIEDCMQANGIETLTEAGLSKLIESEVAEREKTHAEQAIKAAIRGKIFEPVLKPWTLADGAAVTNAGGDDIRLLLEWKQHMQNDVEKQNAEVESEESAENIGGCDGHVGPSVQRSDALVNVAGATQSNLAAEKALSPVQPSLLNPEQARAHDIIVWHLEQTLAGRNLPHLRMIIYGEGGTGKSKVIQTVTQTFVEKKAMCLLVKAAYTGMAASLIDGKTTHKLGAFSLQTDGTVSEDARKKLQQYWNKRLYLILDEYSMLSKTFLTKLSRNIAIGKVGSMTELPDVSFGGVNVILCGDLHQFPPVAQCARESLYRPLDIVNDTLERQIGRTIYEEFKTVVILKEQKRVSDPIWHDFLGHLRHGRVQQRHIDMLRGLIVGRGTDKTDYAESPWKEAWLVTPQHAVRNEWNHSMALKHCHETGQILYKCSAEETIGERQLTLAEKYAVVRARKKEKKRKMKELPREVELAKGMRVLVTNNLETDLDITNGARGTIVDILLHPDEPSHEDTTIVKLEFLPLCVMVRLDRTKASKLAGLEEGVIPIEPMTMRKEYGLLGENGITIRRCIKRRQFPITPAYSFTDYRAQGQTIPAVIVDIATPPSSTLSLFNLYVALSRSSGTETVRLLRDFDDKLFLRAHDPDLLAEDDRLGELDYKTRAWWEKMQQS